jgi:SOS response regulatory protein OraA/RecX
MNKKTVPQGDNEKALKSALNILAYAECTESTLRQKLLAKDYPPESVDFATDYVLKHRYLDEKRYLFRLVEYAGNVSLYGRRRILMQLRYKGFSKEIIDLYFHEAMEHVTEEENCKKALSRLRGKSDKQRMDALVRRGFSFDTVKAAMRAASEEEEFE